MTRYEAMALLDAVAQAAEAARVAAWKADGYEEADLALVRAKVDACRLWLASTEGAKARPADAIRNRDNAVRKVDALAAAVQAAINEVEACEKFSCPLVEQLYSTLYDVRGNVDNLQREAR